MLSAAILPILLCGGADLWAQSVKTKKTTAISVEREVENYREAMSWFRKGEDMVGTERESSDEQAEMFMKAVEIRPDFPEAHFNLGLVNMKRNRTKDAVAEFETVLRLDPNFDTRLHYLLGMAHSEDGNFEKAINAFENGLQQSPDDPAMLEALAYLQTRTNRTDAAITTLQRIASQNSSDAATRTTLGVLQQRTGDIEKAVAWYKDALSIDQENFTAHYNLGLVYVQQQKMAEAVDEFKKANVIEPGNVELLERLGDAQTHLKLYGACPGSYQDAINHGGDREKLLTKLALCLAAGGRTLDAIEALNKSVALGVNNPDIWFFLGDLYSGLEESDGAIDAYLKSLALQPGQKELHLNLGVLYAEKEMFDESMTQLQQAVALDSRYTQAWSNIALVAEMLEDDKEAIAAHEKLVALGNGTAINHFHLGVLYARNDQSDQSITAFAKAIELDPERYRAVLNEELKNVHSVLDSIRYQKRFTDLLNQF